MVIVHAVGVGHAFVSGRRGCPKVVSGSNVVVIITHFSSGLGIYNQQNNCV
jgi:hypothetical protein